MALDAGALRVTERTLANVGPEVTLVEALEAQAEADGLSGRKLMGQVGLDQSLWSRVRRGQEHFGVEACTRIVTRYPSMRDAAARYLVDRFGRPSLTLLENASRLARSRRTGSGRTACR